MNNNIILQNVLRLLLLLLLQIVIFNNVSLYNIIFPNLMILFIIMLPTNTGRIATLLIGFGAGLILDITTNMLGLQAFSFTMVAMARILFADRILLSGEPIVISRPSFRSVSFQHFTVYSLSLLLVYYITYVSIESFSWSNMWLSLITIIFNVIITWLLIMTYQAIFTRREG